MAELKYKFTNDTLFKMLFVKYQDLLKRLAAVLLRVRVEDIWEFRVTNPEMPPEILDDKFCRLDIFMVVNGQIEKTGGEIMVQAIGAYRHVSATKEFQELERKRFEATCNEASAIYANSIDIAKNLKNMGMSVNEIAKATGVTVDHVLKYCP